MIRDNAACWGRKSFVHHLSRDAIRGVVVCQGKARALNLLD